MGYFAARTSLSAAITGLCAALAVVTANADTKEFNASNWLPESTALVSHAYVNWAKDLEEASNGALKANVFTGPVLLPPAAHLSGLRDGVAQITYHAGTYTPADIPRDNVIAQLGIGFTDPFVAAFAMSDINMTDPELIEMWRSHNVVYGGGYSTIPYRLFCTEAVVTLEDIQGKKIRTLGAMMSDWAQSVGAVPVNVPSTEMYSGLEKGQLDCAANTMEQLKSSSLWDVAKHTTIVDLGLYYAGFLYGINQDFWQTLKAEERRILLDTMAVAIVRTQIRYDEAGAEATAEAAEHDVVIHEPDAALAKSITDFRAVARKSAVELGTEKFGIENSEELVERFEKVVAKWEKLLDGIDRTDEAALVAVLKQELYDKIDVESYGVN